MKLVILFMLLLILNSCNSSSETKEGRKIKGNASNWIKPDLDIETRWDTLLNTEKFLVIGNKGMKLDCIFRSEKRKLIKSKGDTLFSDSEAILLGNKRYLLTTWIYAKYKSDFHFSQFRVDSITSKQLKLPDLSCVKVPFCNYLDEKEWKIYVKSECLRQGVNFSGHYTIVQWGCGMLCQNMCIVNRLTGKVNFPDIPDSHIDGCYGIRYQKDSRMLRTNENVLQDFPGYYETGMSFYPEVYEWKNERAVRLE